MSEKLVSIIVTAYNCSYYINSCIKSLLNQSYKKIEIIIINDCSTDKTKLKIKKFKDKRIRLINNKKNIGVSRSLNKGLKLSNGEYVAINDADDISNKNRIEKQIKFLEKNKKVNLLASSILIKKINKKMGIRIIQENLDLIKFYNIFDNYFTPSTFFFRKKKIEKYKIKFRKNFEPCQDFDFISQLYEKTNHLEIFSEPLIIYNERLNSLSYRKKADPFLNKNIKIGQKNILNLLKKKKYKNDAIKIMKIMNKAEIDLNEVKLNRLITMIIKCFYIVTKKKFSLKLYIFIIKFIIFAYQHKYQNKFLFFKYLYKFYQKLSNFSKFFVYKYL